MRILGLALLLAAAAWAGPNPCGSYVGPFLADKYDPEKYPMYFNKINISVDSVKDGRIKGHSVVAGNLRPFAGNVTEKDGLLVVVAKEPGDDQYDGKFFFTLDPSAKTVQGTWVANNPKLAVSKRRYKLDKKTFVYDPHQDLQDKRSSPVYDTYDPATGKSEAITRDAGRFNASTTALKAADVENMYKRDLEVMRNAIYARHGYSFQNRRMRQFFDRMSWYIPVSLDVTAQLTDLEKRNIELLKRYENHAATYYDRFGR